MTVILGHQTWVSAVFTHFREFVLIKGEIKVKQSHVEKQVTSLLCLSDVIMLRCISAYSGTSGVPLLYYKDAVFDGRQEI